MSVYAYVRVSSVDSFNSQLSPEVQLETCRRYAAWKQFEEPQVFTEPHQISGRIAFLKRPAGAELSLRLEKGDHVIFPKLDRAFRDCRDALNTVEWWKDRGVSVHFGDMPFLDPTSPLGELLFRILAIFADWEWRRISERMKEVCQRRKERGERMSQYPGYGFKWGGPHVKGQRTRCKVPIKSELLIMKQIALWRAQDPPLSWENIWRRLNYDSRWCRVCNQGIEGTPKTCPRCGAAANRVVTKDGKEWSVKRIERAHHSYLQYLQEQQEQQEQPPPT